MSRIARLRREAVERSRKHEQRPVPASNAANAALNFLMAPVLLAIAVGLVLWIKIPLDFNLKSPDFNPLVFIPAFFAFFAAYFFARAVWDALIVRKYGTSTLAVKEVRPGEPLTGSVRTRRDLAPTGPYVVRVRCIETVYVSGTRSTDGNRHRDVLRWEATQTVPPGGVRSSEGIPFAFELPADAPPTTRPEGGPVQAGIRWVMEASAPMPGLDYYAVFRLIVSRSRESRNAGA